MVVVLVTSVLLVLLGIKGIPVVTLELVLLLEPVLPVVVAVVVGCVKLKLLVVFALVVVDGGKVTVLLELVSLLALSTRVISSVLLLFCERFGNIEPPRNKVAIIPEITAKNAKAINKSTQLRRIQSIILKTRFLKEFR